jgi:transcriptional regulator with XRE-family HTH domain
MVMTMVEAESAWAHAIGRALREELGARPQRWLADQMGIDPATVSRFMRGQQLPTLDQLDGAAKAFGISRRLLLERAGYISDETELDLSLLPPEARAAVMGAYRGVLEGLRRRIEGASDGVSERT